MRTKYVDTVVKYRCPPKKAKNPSIIILLLQFQYTRSVLKIYFWLKFRWTEKLSQNLFPKLSIFDRKLDLDENSDTDQILTILDFRDKKVVFLPNILTEVFANNFDRSFCQKCWQKCFAKHFDRTLFTKIFITFCQNFLQNFLSKFLWQKNCDRTCVFKADRQFVFLWKQSSVWQISNQSNLANVLFSPPFWKCEKL